MAIFVGQSQLPQEALKQGVNNNIQAKYVGFVTDDSDNDVTVVVTLEAGRPLTFTDNSKTYTYTQTFPVGAERALTKSLSVIVEESAGGEDVCNVTFEFTDSNGDTFTLHDFFTF